MWLLYHMVNKYLGGDKIALAVAGVYGLSNGFFTCAVFLRMYAVMTFMVVAMCYIHLKISGDEFVLKKRTMFQLTLITFLGYLTHYYFVIYAIGMAAVFVVRMCICKKWRSLIQYISVLGITAVAGLCIWPFALKHVFSGYRGVDSLNTILSGQFHWIKIKLILNQICGQLFGGNWWIPVAAAVIIIGTVIVSKNRKRYLGTGILTFIPIMVYVITVAQIVPFYVDRYVMCTYPFWCMLVVFALYKGIKSLSKWKLLTNILSGKISEYVNIGLYAAGILGLVLINNGFMHEPGYLGRNGQETYIVPENSHCVYVIPDGSWNESAEDTLMLSKCEQVAVVYQSELPCLAKSYTYEDGDCIILTIQKSLDEQNVVSMARQILGISHVPEAFREEVYNTVRIYYGNLK